MVRVGVYSSSSSSVAVGNQMKLSLQPRLDIVAGHDARISGFIPDGGVYKAVSYPQSFPPPMPLSGRLGEWRVYRRDTQPTLRFPPQIYTQSIRFQGNIYES
jgi:hypothetical protein